MRIGIWCDYGFTLEPSEGIGVFVDNLVGGLLVADPTCHVTLKANPRDAHVLDAAVARAPGRIAVVTEPYPGRWTRTQVKIARKIRRYVGHQGPDRPLVRRVDRLLADWQRHADRVGEAARQRIIAGCDVWLLPYVGLDQSFDRPTVPVIHDLVSYHFPGIMSPAQVREFKVRVDRQVARARVVACMSEFIRRHDLVGTLGLPLERTRVIPPAVPADILGGTDHAAGGDGPPGIAAAALPDGVRPPFLLYPARFKTYKNHAFLVDALALLHRRGEREWQVVFTGIRSCPRDLARQIDRLGLADHVRVLRKVSRDDLGHLYRHAFATVVPSLYEQGSFPLLEALTCGCPAVASRIPSLVEQFAPLGEAMPFVDPADPAALLPILARIGADRSSFIAAQAAGFRGIQASTWADAAAGWLAVLREVTEAEQPAPRGAAAA